MSELRSALLAVREALQVALDDAKTEGAGHAVKFIRKSQDAISKTVAYFERVG